MQRSCFTPQDRREPFGGSQCTAEPVNTIEVEKVQQPTSSFSHRRTQAETQTDGSWESWRKLQTPHPWVEPRRPGERATAPFCQICDLVVALETHLQRLERREEAMERRDMIHKLLSDDADDVLLNGRERGFRGRQRRCWLSVHRLLAP